MRDKSSTCSSSSTAVSYFFVSQSNQPSSTLLSAPIALKLLEDRRSSRANVLSDERISSPVSRINAKVFGSSAMSFERIPPSAALDANHGQDVIAELCCCTHRNVLFLTVCVVIKPERKNARPIVCPARRASLSRRPAMSNASDVLVERLLAWGVDTIFGLPGDGINGVFEALRTHKDQIRFIHVRHEEAAAFMACAYAKVTGRIWGCIATSRA